MGYLCALFVGGGVGAYEHERSGEPVAAASVSADQPGFPADGAALVAEAGTVAAVQLVSVVVLVAAGVLALTRRSPLSRWALVGAFALGLLVVDEDVPTIAVPNVLVVREDMPANMACALTSLMVDKKDELVKVHPAAKEIDAKTMSETGPIPLHDGSERALEDKS